MSFEVPNLPYAFDALEPHIDARTMEIHHDKHHAAYVNMLNGAVEAAGDACAGKSVKELICNLDAVPEAQRGAVRNHGGGHFNHSLFWSVMAADGGSPDGELAAAIDAAFGSLDGFQEALHKAGMTRFGSGWAWLCSDGGKLSTCSTANQDNPLMGPAHGGHDCGTPILGVDVWEHAYYLRYQNLRGDYLNAFFNVINWAEVDRHYAETL